MAKRGSRARFATREGLDQPRRNSQQLFSVANIGLQLHLPHESGVCVANRDSRPRFATQAKLDQLEKSLTVRIISVNVCLSGL